MITMEVDRLIDRIKLKVHDNAFNNDFIIETLNQCNISIASNVYINELSVTGNIVVHSGDNLTPLPKNFHRNLSYCVDISYNNKIKVYRNRKLIDKVVSTNNIGNISFVSVDGVNLYSKYINNVDTELMLYYYKLPDNIVEGGIFPSYIPYDYVYNIYFNYVVAQIYDYIDDGVDGEKINTTYYEDRYNKSLSKLKLLIGDDPDYSFRPNNADNNFNFEGI